MFKIFMALKLENTFNAIHASFCFLSIQGWWAGAWEWVPFLRHWDVNHSTSRQVNGADAIVSALVIMASAILFTRQKSLSVWYWQFLFLYLVVGVNILYSVGFLLKKIIKFNFFKKNKISLNQPVSVRFFIIKTRSN